MPNPRLVKVPFAFPGTRMENTPVVYQGKPLLLQNVREVGTKAKDFWYFPAPGGGPFEDHSELWTVAE